MELLVSPIGVDEIDPLLENGIDIIDLKSVDEGALGAPQPNMVRQILERLREADCRTSLSLGDLPDKPGTAALAAIGASALGVDDIKAGLHGVATEERARAVLSSIQSSLGDQARPRLIAAGYADYRSFDGLAPADLVRAASTTHCHAVMLDTWRKNGRSLFDALPADELDSFCLEARRHGLAIGFAGSIGFGHVSALRRLRPDFVGVRGALCVGGDRRRPIAPDRVKRWVGSLRERLVG